MSSNPAYVVIKFGSDLRQVGGFLRVLRFPPPIKQVRACYCISTLRPSTLY
jgi:hypothetical protein